MFTESCKLYTLLYCNYYGNTAWPGKGGFPGKIPTPFYISCEKATIATMAGLLLDPIFKAEESEKQESDEVCCPLPLSLQDLCLLAIMSHLDSYQVDLLASLPLQSFGAHLSCC